MLALNCLISFSTAAEVPVVSFDFIHEVKIVSSWKNLTDTCIIKQAKNIKIRDAFGNSFDSRDVITKGMKVNVKLGYAGKLVNEFDGYVARTQPKVPFVIDCEDEMWMLKQNNWNKTWGAMKLETMIREIAPGYRLNVVDWEMPGFIAGNITSAGILEIMRRQWGLTSWFRRDVVTGLPVLSVGFAYSLNPSLSKGIAPANEYHYDFYQNVIANNLEYRTKEDSRIKVRAICTMPDNTKFEVILGDIGGEEVTVPYYNMSKAAVTAAATNFMNSLKVDGLRGNIHTFGQPAIKHGDYATLINTEYPLLNNKYFVDKVETTFGVKGYRRVVDLGKIAV